MRKFFAAILAAGLPLISFAQVPATSVQINQQVGNQQTTSGVILGRVFNVKAPPFLAKGDGVTDDSAAIRAAATAAAATSPVGTLYFPTGNYVYAGAALNVNNLVAVSDGPNSVTITLTNSDYFYKPTSLQAMSFRYINVTNGKGFVKVLNTGTNVAGFYEVSGCLFYGYTECAIGSLSSDMPYWKIDNCIFNGTQTSSKGIALAGFADTSSITRCAFQQDLHHIELGGWGNAHISQNEFIHYTVHATPSSDIWLVASQITLNSYSGLSVTENKFGNENQYTGDFYFLVAAQQGSGDFVTNTWATTDLGASLNYVVGGVSARDNQINSVAGFTNGFITSYTPFLRQFKLDNLGAAMPPIKLDCTYVNDRLNQTNEIDLTSYTNDASEGLQNPLSTYPLGVNKDPNGYVEGSTAAVHYYPAGADTSYTPLAEPTNVSSLGTSNVTYSAINDAYGNAGGQTVTFTSSSGYAVLNFTPSVALKPVWIEMDLRASVSNPLPYLVFQVNDQATGLLIWFRRYITLTAQWRKYRFLWTPSTTAGAQFLFINQTGYAPGTATNVDVARIFVYQADEPVAHEKESPIMLSLLEGITAPAAVTARRTLYVDSADSLLKEITSGGTVYKLLTDVGTETLSPVFAALYLNNTVVDRKVWGETSGVLRWGFGTNSTAESGSNVGSDFEIHAYSDTGTDLGTAFNIFRSTKQVKVQATTSNTGTVDQGALDVAGGASIDKGLFLGQTFYYGQSGYVFGSPGLSALGIVSQTAASQTYEDVFHANGTYALATANSLAVPTFTSSQTSVVFTDATNGYDAGPPIAGSGVSFTNTAWARITNGNLKVIGAALSSSSSGGVGYMTGAGGTISQATNRSTGVTLNTPTGTITGQATSLAASTAVTFTVTDSSVAADDTVVLSVKSGAPVTTIFYVSAVAAGSFNITEFNENLVTADTSAPVINFAVLKGSHN